MLSNCGKIIIEMKFKIVAARFFFVVWRNYAVSTKLSSSTRASLRRPDPQLCPQQCAAPPRRVHVRAEASRTSTETRPLISFERPSAALTRRTLRKWNARRPRTHRTRPLRPGSGCSFKNPNPRPMIYQTLIIKKMSGEGHLAPH